MVVIFREDAKIDFAFVAASTLLEVPFDGAQGVMSATATQAYFKLYN